jgi:hypothetical protein
MLCQIKLLDKIFMKLFLLILLVISLIYYKEFFEVVMFKLKKVNIEK